MSEETTRASLNGVFLHGSAQQVAFVATDGHRLARATCKGTFGDLTRDGVIVPARALASMSRAAAEATSPVEIRIADGKGHAGFVAQVGRVPRADHGAPARGPVPELRAGDPQGQSARSSRCRARTSWRRWTSWRRTRTANTQQVRFSLSRDRLSVSSATADFGAGEQQVAAEYQGEDSTSATTRDTCCRRCGTSPRRRWCSVSRRRCRPASWSRRVPCQSPMRNCSAWSCRFACPTSPKPWAGGR